MTVLGHSQNFQIFNLTGVCFLCWKPNGALQSNRWIRSDNLPIQSKPDLCINSWRSIKLINWCWSTLPLSPLENLGALFVLLICEKLSLQLSWVMASFPCLTWFFHVKSSNSCWKNSHFLYKAMRCRYILCFLSK